MKEAFPPLSPELQDRATQLVLHAVALYPQSGNSAVLLADRLMDDFDPAPASQTGIGIREMTRWVVDPVPTASRINDIHRAFGIGYEVSPEEAAGITTGIAYGALDCIRVQTVVAAMGRYALPKGLAERRVAIFSGSNDPTRLTGCWREGAVRLHGALAENDMLRAAVKRHMYEQTLALRRNSRHQQQVQVLKHQDREMLFKAAGLTRE